MASAAFAKSRASSLDSLARDGSFRSNQRRASASRLASPRDVPRELPEARVPALAWRGAFREVFCRDARRALSPATARARGQSDLRDDAARRIDRGRAHRACVRPAARLERARGSTSVGKRRWARHRDGRRRADRLVARRRW